MLTTQTPPPSSGSGSCRDDDSSDPRRATGRLGEDFAETHLARLGYITLARNQRTREGEIDLIVFGHDTLVFVEVKTERKSRRTASARLHTSPTERLRPRQRVRLRRAAARWLSEENPDRPTAKTIRFDVIGVILDARGRLLRLDHLEAAW